VRWRIAVSSAIAVFAGSFCWFLLAHFHQGGGDFNWAIWLGRDLVSRQDPYARPTQYYPLPAGFFALPVCWLPPSIAGGIFYGAGSGLMAFGLTRGSYWRLLVFLAYPYWAGLLTAQWTPLLMASALFPLLLPATLAKPQIGLPIALTHLTRRGLVACAIALGLSLVLRPRWPMEWIGQIGGYDRFVPLLVLPGPLLLLALFRWRERDARFLLLMAAMPQRWFYDQLVLWLIPRSRREILATVACSWVPGIWRWYHTPRSFIEVGRWAVFFFYIPMLIVLVVRWWAERRQKLSLRIQS
jgi:hypothetical protein